MRLIASTSVPAVWGEEDRMGSRQQTWERRMREKKEAKEPRRKGERRGEQRGKRRGEPALGGQ